MRKKKYLVLVLLLVVGFSFVSLTKVSALTTDKCNYSISSEVVSCQPGQNVLGLIYSNEVGSNYATFETKGNYLSQISPELKVGSSWIIQGRSWQDHTLYDQNLTVLKIDPMKEVTFSLVELDSVGSGINSNVNLEVNNSLQNNSLPSENKNSHSSFSGYGIFVGLIILLIFVVLFFLIRRKNN